MYVRLKLTRLPSSSAEKGVSSSVCWGGETFWPEKGKDQHKDLGSMVPQNLLVWQLC